VSGRQNQTTTTIVVGTAIAAAALVFVSIPAIILELASAWAKIRYARYPTSEDVFGWGVLISAPLVLALDLGVSIGIGMIIFHSFRDCRWPGDVSGRQPRGSSGSKG
jgi:hypothetical protein